MTRVNVAQSCAQDWAYLAEGGSTIVFSYAGPFHPSFTGKVLRLRKTSISHDRTIDEQEDPVIAFQNTVVAALVPSRFLPDLEVVLLDATWLAALEASRDGDRPIERRKRDQIDKARQKGILATDLIGGADILAIEIKVRRNYSTQRTAIVTILLAQVGFLAQFHSLVPGDCGHQDVHMQVLHAHSLQVQGGRCSYPILSSGSLLAN